MARKIKDSGIEWTGEIGSNFRLLKVKYIFYVLDQYRSPVAADQRNQEAGYLYDYYGASGVIDKIDGYTIDDHVMLIGEDGANLRTRNLPLMYEVNGKAWINNHAHILKPKENMYFRFLFFAMESLDINTYITGSAQPKLSQEKLKNIYVPVPNCKEQKKIADFLDKKCAAIDFVIEKANISIKEYKKLKQSIITRAVTKGIRGCRPMKDSGIEWIGEIPEEWKCPAMRHVVKKVVCGIAATPEYVDEKEGVLFLSAQNIQNDKIDLNIKRYIPVELHRKLTKNTKPEKGDIIQVRVGASIGKAAIIDIDEEFSIYVSLSLIKLRPTIYNKYMCYYLGTDSFKKNAEIYIDYAGSQGNLNVSDLKEMYVPLPTYIEQVEIVKYLEKKCGLINQLIEQKEQLINEIEFYKKSLIYEYVTGKKEVPNCY